MMFFGSWVDILPTYNAHVQDPRVARGHCLEMKSQETRKHHGKIENEEVDRGQNSMSFKEKDLFNKRQREQWVLSKDYRNKRRKELCLKKSDNQHTDNYTRYRQQLNSERSEGIICNHNEVGK
ncbi:hypothetical protein Fot_09953 [Forsythia ovata]|uniref:Uncharacterized protein n=1 Tax=Forsythia ovata TaxID=205694 RepID=A0ABD1WI08_9LAMI